MAEYDKNNIFAKILRGEIPVQKLYEDDYALAFPDLYPKAPLHILVIPKGEYISFSDFVEKAPLATTTEFFKAVGEVAKAAGLEKNGYRLITNKGLHARQDIPHFHMHIVGGAPLGPLLVSEAP